MTNCTLYIKRQAPALASFAKWGGEEGLTPKRPTRRRTLHYRISDCVRHTPGSCRNRGRSEGPRGRKLVPRARDSSQVVRREDNLWWRSPAVPWSGRKTRRILPRRWIRRNRRTSVGCCRDRLLDRLEGCHLTLPYNHIFCRLCSTLVYPGF